jgi:hypothetical protein
VTEEPEDDGDESGADLDHLLPRDEADYEVDHNFEEEPIEEPQSALPPKLEAWRKRSATGAILTGFALGLQQAFEKKREEPGIIMQTSGDPPRDLPVEADFEFRRPRQSVVNIRPWLLPAKPPGATSTDSTASPEDTATDSSGEATDEDH